MKWRVLKEDEYRAKVEKVITRHEGNVPSVYIDNTGIPTVGPGKALVVNVNKRWVVSQGRSVEGVETLEASLGKKLTPEQMNMLQTAADNLNRYGQSPKAYQENAKIYYENDQVRGSKAWQTANNSSFGIYLDESQQEDLKNRVIDATEKELDHATGMKGSEAIPPSEERAALASVFHHQPTAITPKMREALQNGDRTKVVEEIQKNERFANRRQQEADQFGRPNDPAIIRHENNPQADLENTMRTTPRNTIDQKPGQPLPHPMPQPEPTGPTYDPSPTTVPLRPSILDGMGSVLNQAGQAIATAGRVTFDMAMGLGKETLQQALQLALTQGGNKETLKQAAQLAMRQMLANMHAATMERVAQMATPGGYAGPLKNLMQDPRAPVENFMNNPHNQGVFDTLVSEVQRLLGVYPDLNPITVLVDRSLDKVRNGEFKIPNDMMLPNLPSKGGKGEQNISIFGVQLPILMPEIEIIGINPNAEPIVVGGAAESPSVSIARGGNGAIQVRSYTRDGATVRGHTRSRPDDDVSNNLSFRAKT
ncbi:MAG: hypothetical protein ACK5YK_02005 [Pseudomonadota bacterium]